MSIKRLKIKEGRTCDPKTDMSSPTQYSDALSNISVFVTRYAEGTIHLVRIPLWSFVIADYLEK